MDTQNQQPQNPQPPLTKREKRELRRSQQEQDKILHLKSKRSGMLAFWVIITLIVAGTVFGIVLLAKNGPAPTATGTIPIVNAADHTKGAATAKTTVVEYSDFQCPACGAYYPLIKRVSEEFSDRALFVYRNYPLRSLHPNAQLAAQAAEAAGTQNKFWEMHDRLFETQTAWSGLPNPKNIFITYATELGLDANQFTADLTSATVKDKIDADIAGANQANVNATPTFFVNGQSIQNPRSYEEFKTLLEAALAQ